ncbi:hypothetical protein Pla144_16810 [Bythopirellula polymerisocia]|uniref:Uncharacterized protein n=1 Tax=Bythopirellula polymerisocia TaxID=2528003 RepID=A0A5C6CTW4_9BACT|nr:hypothetical protein Pla144_16810 [Bythopirellula polymerisocia]
MPWYLRTQTQNVRVCKRAFRVAVCDIAHQLSKSHPLLSMTRIQKFLSGTSHMRACPGCIGRIAEVDPPLQIWSVIKLPMDHPTGVSLDANSQRCTSRFDTAAPWEKPSERSVDATSVSWERSNLRRCVGSVSNRSRFGAAGLHAQDTPSWVSCQSCGYVTFTTSDSDLSWALSSYGVWVLN